MPQTEEGFLFYYVSHMMLEDRWSIGVDSRIMEPIIAQYHRSYIQPLRNTFYSQTFPRQAPFGDVQYTYQLNPTAEELLADVKKELSVSRIAATRDWHNQSYNKLAKQINLKDVQSSSRKDLEQYYAYQLQDSLLPQVSRYYDQILQELPSDYSASVSEQIEELITQLAWLQVAWDQAYHVYKQIYDAKQEEFCQFLEGLSPPNNLGANSKSAWLFVVGDSKAVTQLFKKSSFVSRLLRHSYALKDMIINRVDSLLDWVVMPANHLANAETCYYIRRVKQCYQLEARPALYQISQDWTKLTEQMQQYSFEARMGQANITVWQEAGLEMPDQLFPQIPPGLPSNILLSELVFLCKLLAQYATQIEDNIEAFKQAFCNVEQLTQGAYNQIASQTDAEVDSQLIERVCDSWSNINKTLSMFQEDASQASQFAEDLKVLQQRVQVWQDQLGPYLNKSDGVDQCPSSQSFQGADKLWLYNGELDKPIRSTLRIPYADELFSWPLMYGDQHLQDVDLSDIDVSGLISIGSDSDNSVNKQELKRLQIYIERMGGGKASQKPKVKEHSPCNKQQFNDFTAQEDTEKDWCDKIDANQLKKNDKCPWYLNSQNYQQRLRDVTQPVYPVFYEDLHCQVKPDSFEKLLNMLVFELGESDTYSSLELCDRSQAAIANQLNLDVQNSSGLHVVYAERLYEDVLPKVKEHYQQLSNQCIYSEAQQSKIYLWAKLAWLHTWAQQSAAFIAQQYKMSNDKAFEFIKQKGRLLEQQYIEQYKTEHPIKISPIEKTQQYLKASLSQTGMAQADLYVKELLSVLCYCHEVCTNGGLTLLDSMVWTSAYVTDDQALLSLKGLKYCDWHQVSQITEYIQSLTLLPPEQDDTLEVTKPSSRPISCNDPSIAVPVNISLSFFWHHLAYLVKCLADRQALISQDAAKFEQFFKPVAVMSHQIWQFLGSFSRRDKPIEPQHFECPQTILDEIKSHTSKLVKELHKAYYPQTSVTSDQSQRLDDLFKQVRTLRYQVCWFRLLQPGFDYTDYDQHYLQKVFGSEQIHDYGLTPQGRYFIDVPKDKALLDSDEQLQRDKADYVKHMKGEKQGVAIKRACQSNQLSLAISSDQQDSATEFDSVKGNQQHAYYRQSQTNDQQRQAYINFSQKLWDDLFIDNYFAQPDYESDQSRTSQSSRSRQHTT